MSSTTQPCNSIHRSQINHACKLPTSGDKSINSAYFCAIKGKMALTKYEPKRWHQSPNKFVLRLVKKSRRKFSKYDHGKFCFLGESKLDMPELPKDGSNLGNYPTIPWFATTKHAVNLQSPVPEYPIYIAAWVYSRCLFASLMVKCCMSLLSRKPCWCPLTIAKSGYLEKTTSWCEQILPSIIEFV